MRYFDGRYFTYTDSSPLIRGLVTVVGQSNINFNHNSPLDLEQGPQRIEDKGGRHGLSPTSYPDVDPECVCA
jgi:hypothetical protein